MCVCLSYFTLFEPLNKHLDIAWGPKASIGQIFTAATELLGRPHTRFWSNVPGLQVADPPRPQRSWGPMSQTLQEPSFYCREEPVSLIRSPSKLYPLKHKFSSFIQHVFWYQKGKFSQAYMRVQRICNSIQFSLFVLRQITRNVISRHLNNIVQFKPIGVQFIVGKSRQVYLLSTVRTQGNSKCFTAT